jgi:hypothetical protein
MTMTGILSTQGIYKESNDNRIFSIPFLSLLCMLKLFCNLIILVTNIILPIVSFYNAKDGNKEKADEASVPNIMICTATSSETSTIKAFEKCCKIVEENFGLGKTSSLPVIGYTEGHNSAKMYQAMTKIVPATKKGVRLHLLELAVV